MASIPVEDAAPELLTIAETAAALRVERSTVYRAMKRGELPFTTVGQRRRVRRQDLENYLQPAAPSDTAVA
jgi:excisionase family DNA binding protein